MICRPEIIVFQILGNTANAMGWVHIEAADGPEVKWIKPLDMCATMMAPCVLLFTIHQAFCLAIDVDYRSN